MGTRASIAFIDYDKNSNKYFLFVSDQFNGDMAPDMSNGKKFITHFVNIYYLDKRNHQAKLEKMEAVIRKLADDFGYERELSFKCIPLEKTSDGFVLINLRTKWLDKKKKEIDYKNDVWSSWFDYSDYLYIVPLFDPKHKFAIVSEKDDGSYENCYLIKDRLDVFCFRDYVGSVSPDNGKYIEKDFYEDGPTPEKLISALDDEPFAAPPLNTNVLPQRKYVEILAQYKDDNRDCLVVRTADNKHVLFKEMR